MCVCVCVCIYIYIGHPVVFNELQDKQTVYSCCQTQQYIQFLVFRILMVTCFILSDHLTETSLKLYAVQLCSIHFNVTVSIMVSIRHNCTAYTLS